MRFKKKWQGSWWWLGELYEVPKCLLWRGLKHHCLMYNVSCIFFNKCLYLSYYMAGYLLDRPYIYITCCITQYITALPLCSVSTVILLTFHPTYFFIAFLFSVFSYFILSFSNLGSWIFYLHLFPCWSYHSELLTCYPKPAFPIVFIISENFDSILLDQNPWNHPWLLSFFHILHENLQGIILSLSS